MERFRSAEGHLIPDVYEQVVACGSGDESRIRQLGLRHGKGRAGRLHHAVDVEVAARRSRAVVAEEVQQAVAVGVVGREQRRCVEDLAARRRLVGCRYRRASFAGTLKWNSCGPLRGCRPIPKFASLRGTLMMRTSEPPH